jgi:3-hydroxybutyryl-CoA dehydrogenase
MATGIAQVCVTAGLPTVLVARTEQKARAAHDTVRRALERAAARGRLSEPDLAAATARLDAGSGADLVAGCDLVVEAVVEDAAVKREVFAALDAAASPGAVLATSTSSLSVTALAEVTSRPGDVIGMHFFNPPSAIRLVEIGRSPRTAAQTVATVHDLAGRLGRFPVHCGDRAGFIVNALLLPYLNAAVAVHAAGGLSAERIDQAVSAGLGYPLGPLALLDTIGLDVSQAILRNLHQAFDDPAMAPKPDLDALVRAGRLGRKTGHGFHAYPAR